MKRKSSVKICEYMSLEALNYCSVTIRLVGRMTAC